MTKTLIPALVFIMASLSVHSQKIDSIYFHLYTDSLKKGPLHYNYINVDGLKSDGNYLPLDTKQLIFKSDAGKWEGNNLILDENSKIEYVTVTAVLKSNPEVSKTTRIYLKKNVAEEPLKSAEELLQEWDRNKKKKNRYV
ncbi:MAG: hypothetical protein JWN76_3141 [Chitinophagaceae bacterium]|nr:hypothetical protein [Chitinophagaceae bacterium]